jgi:hypothetical protein
MGFPIPQAFLPASQRINAYIVPRDNVRVWGFNIIALYDFTAATEEELSFSAEEPMRLWMYANIGGERYDWVYCKNAVGVEGYAPTNYFRYP